MGEDGVLLLGEGGGRVGEVGKEGKGREERKRVKKGWKEGVCVERLLPHEAKRRRKKVKSCCYFFFS